MVIHLTRTHNFHQLQMLGMLAIPSISPVLNILMGFPSTKHYEELFQDQIIISSNRTK